MHDTRAVLLLVSLLIELGLIEGEEESDRILLSLQTGLHQGCLFLVVLDVELGSSLDERTGLLQISSQTSPHQRDQTLFIP